MSLLISLLLGLQQPTKVACVGASITQGIGVVHPEADSYPAQLQKILGDRYLVKNFGNSGSCVAKSGSHPYWDTAEFKASLAFRPDIVLIFLGTNDSWNDWWEKGRDNLVPNYKDLIKQYRDLSSHPKVYAILPTPMFYGAEDRNQRNFEDGVLPLLRQAARESDVPTINLFRALDGQGALFPDHLHPNERGAGLIAEEVAGVIADQKLEKARWKLVSADSEQIDEGPARMAIDGDPETYWHTQYDPQTPKHPHEIVVDMGETVSLSGFRILPRQDGGVNGRIKDYELYLSVDGKAWGAPVVKGTLPNSREVSAVRFKDPTTGRFFKFVALSEVNGGPWTTIAEIDMVKARSPQSPSSGQRQFARR